MNITTMTWVTKVQTTCT